MYAKDLPIYLVYERGTWTKKHDQEYSCFVEIWSIIILLLSEKIKHLILWISLWCCILLEFNLKNWWERNIWEVRYAMEKRSEFIGKIREWMNGSEGVTCLAYPITYARDTDDSKNLKNDSCFFKKKILSTHRDLSQWFFRIS